MTVTETNFNYTCPNCSKECAVTESMTDQNVICPKIEKYTGKPDFFSMTAAEARFVVLLIEKLRGAGI